MSWLDKIKSIFSAKETEANPPDEADIKIAELEKWFEDKIKGVTEEKTKAMNETCAEIRERISETKQKMLLLEEARLRNEKIPERAKQILAGNKDEYLRKTNQFLMHSEPPQQIDRESMRRYCRDFDTAISFLKKSTVKQSFVLKEFHEHEAYQIIASIKSIEDRIFELKQLVEHDDFKRIDALKEDIREVNKFSKAKNRLKSDIGANTQEMDTSKNMLESIEHELTKINSTAESAEIQEDINKKERIDNEIKIISLTLSDKFSNLRKALEKFKRGRIDEKLIDSYIENALDGLVKDKRLEILLAIDGLNKSIEKNQIELKDSIKQKTIQTCTETTKEELQEYLQKYRQLTEESGEIRDRISRSTLLKMKGDLESKRAFLNERISKLEAINKTLSADMANINFDSLKEKLKEEIKDLLNFDMKIDYD